MKQIIFDEVKTSSVVDMPDMDEFNTLNATGRKKYYAQGFYGQGVIVAVIDSGCTKHPEFEDRLLEGANLCSSKMTAPDSSDDFGHGTHVSGIIAGKNCGVAPRAKILPIKIFDVMGDGQVTDVIRAVEYATNWIDPQGKRVDIINMSLSTPAAYFKTHPEQLRQYEAAIKNAVKAGIAVIVAAGNTGKEQVLYPAWFEDVITVGAVDTEKKTAFFTTRSKQVDVCQLGVDILSTYLDGKTYAKASGTSMAAPHVSGIAALMISKYKALFGKYMPEPAIYESLKLNTIDMDISGVDLATGAGFCTLNPTPGKITIKMKENDPNILVNGQIKRSDAAPITVPPGRFMAPVRFLFETIGGQASYDNNTKTATFEVEV